MTTKPAKWFNLSMDFHLMFCQIFEIWSRKQIWHWPTVLLHIEPFGLLFDVLSEIFEIWRSAGFIFLTLLKPGVRLCPSHYYQSFLFKNYLNLCIVKSNLFTHHMFVPKIVRAHKPVNWYVLYLLPKNISAYYVWALFWWMK